MGLCCAVVHSRAAPAAGQRPWSTAAPPPLPCPAPRSFDKQTWTLVDRGEGGGRSWATLQYDSPDGQMVRGRVGGAGKFWL